MPQIAVRDGVAHIASAVADTLEMTLHYPRVDAGGATAWTVGGALLGGSLPPLPALAVGDDGSVFVGVGGSFNLRRPGDRDERTVPVSVTIVGNGQVESSDGTIDCSESCTVMAEVGRRLLITATATDGAAPQLSCGLEFGSIDVAFPEICNLDVTSVDGQIPLAITVTFP